VSLDLLLNTPITMASKELRINTGDTSTSSDSSSDDEQQETSTEEERQDMSMEEELQDVSMEEVSPKLMPPKMRIKLTLRMSSPVKSPAEAETVPPATTMKEDIMDVKHDPTISGKIAEKSPAPSSGVEVEAENDEEEVAEATIVNAEEERTSVDVEAKVIETTKLPASKSKTSLPPPPRNPSRGKELPKPPVAATKKRKAPSKPSLPTSNTARTVRLPPLTSPGMLLPPSTATFRGDADANGYTTPASVFDYCMNMAGYTIKARTEDPHRGSSVRRQVGDMFDSDVSFAVNFPPLVPKEVWSLSKTENQKKRVEAGTENDQKPPTETNDQSEKQVEEEVKRDAAQILLRSLAPAKEIQNGTSTDSSFSRKRRRPWQFSEMVPQSLTIPYPESYIQKRVRYAEKVKERERAIIVNQEANQKFEDAKDRYALLSSAKRHTEELPPPPVRPVPITIPPIPEPVTPPHISELDGEEFKDVDDSRHPIYLPKTHEKLTTHLDPACFHITNGRYFGAYANTIADPNFVGPNAPGITGLNFAGGSGLATAYTGSTSGGPASFLASVSANSGAASGGNKLPFPGKSASKKSKASITAPVIPKTAVPEDTTSSAGQDDAISGDGPAPTSTSTALKRLIDDGGDEALQMKNTIVRAAVYAARAGTHSMSFVGSNGEVYPDVSKAFAAHGGVRPCIKCKNNKQGAYHCRLRRKHDALDYDGGDSPSALAPLFKEPLASLLVTK
jgi:hypothetical protein